MQLKKCFILQGGLLSVLHGSKTVADGKPCRAETEGQEFFSPPCSLLASRRGSKVPVPGVLVWMQNGVSEEGISTSQPPGPGM